MDGYVRASGNIFCAIDPRFRCLGADIRRLQCNRRVIGAVKPFRAFLADKHTPNGIAAMPKKKDRVVRRLRTGGSLCGLRYLSGLLGRSPGLLGEGLVNVEVGAEKQR